ncbi:tail sheath [Haloarcula virus HCTV-8]|uniref:Tail sheath n=3 Tax=Haloferacalesvirus hv5 TaxID=1273753 RepID=A0AAE9BX03_9CAUD|nr:tail sheath [Haloarcula phage HCTV-7]UBF20460.1 tail sheath [Haloarcula phage HCTV-9]UBF20576.1 tail sheath [Haloarcula phage HCTV-11]UBF20918.1 tail sheath [Haloarcula virus HCTV-8]UBF21030.1 tail sheath [Haloarcula virus HCTV-10]
MADYGNTIEPGIVTNVNSALSVTSSGGAPADVGLVGQADLVNGTAQTNAVYQVTRATKAREWFGEDSPLTRNVLDALSEGAYPVYAVAVDLVDVTGEDLSALASNTGTLAEGPVSENADDVVFNIDGVELETVLVYEDLSELTPDAGEVYVNPATGDFSIDPETVVGNTGDSVDYATADYVAGNQALADGAGGAVDFFVPLTEDVAVTEDAQATVNAMATEYNLALAIVGATPGLDPSEYSNSFDDSRVQVVYPARDAEGYSTLGAYAGLRAKLGITTTPINKRLSSVKSLGVSLNKAQRGELIDERVVPLADESEGARIADDVNSVSDTNAEEAGIRFGFTRLVMDYVITTIRVNEQPFIGRLNSRAVRASLEGLLSNQLNTLKRSNAIVDYRVSVSRVDATTAAVEIQVKTAKPLRFIENTVTIGTSA